MHIVITVNTAWNVANFRAPLVQSFLNSGHRVTVLVPEDDTVPKLREMGCAVELIEMDCKGMSPKNDLKLVYDMRRAFQRLRPDIVFSYTIKNNIYGAFAARSLGIPFVPNITGLGTAFLGSPIVSRLVRILYSQAFGSLPYVIFQNEDDRDAFLGMALCRPDQAVLVPGSGIDLTRFAPAEARDCPGSELVFLMIARVLADKGVREYAEAARLIRQRFPETRFQLLGDLDAVNRTALSADEVKGWVDSGAIDYLGATDDVRPAIAAADCIVLPSYREGAPRVLMEGAAMGRPLITTDVPGCRAVVRAGRSGFLCEARSAASLAEAIGKIIMLPVNERLAMGQEARRDMVSRYDVNRVVETYNKFLMPQIFAGRTIAAE